MIIINAWFEFEHLDLRLLLQNFIFFKNANGTRKIRTLLYPFTKFIKLLIEDNRLDLNYEL